MGKEIQEQGVPNTKIEHRCISTSKHNDPAINEVLTGHHLTCGIDNEGRFHLADVVSVQLGRFKAREISANGISLPPPSNGLQASWRLTLCPCVERSESPKNHGVVVCEVLSREDMPRVFSVKQCVPQIET